MTTMHYNALFRSITKSNSHKKLRAQMAKKVRHFRAYLRICQINNTNTKYKYFISHSQNVYKRLRSAREILRAPIGRFLRNFEGSKLT